MFKNKRITYVAGALIASTLLLTSCVSGEETTGGKRIGPDTSVATKTPEPTETSHTSSNSTDAAAIVSTVNAFYADLYGGDYDMENFNESVREIEEELTVFAEKYDLDIANSTDPAVISSLTEEAQSEYRGIINERLPITKYFSEDVELEAYTGAVIITLSVSGGGVPGDGSDVTFDEDAVTVSGDSATVDTTKAEENSNIESKYLVGEIVGDVIPFVREDNEWLIDTELLYQSIVEELNVTANSEIGDIDE